MTYSVKEIFYTLQGEGANAGRPAVFCRFAGCNLWTGLERDRSSAACQFCDTDFVGTNGGGGGKFKTADALSRRIAQIWQARSNEKRFVVFTGGEPLLQLDEPLIEAVHAEGFRIAVETNGTLIAPEGIDWICVSPKANAQLQLTRGDELKLVFPQISGEPSRYERLAFEHFFLQPMDGEDAEQNVELAVQYCLENPKWRLSLQTHKLLGIR